MAQPGIKDIAERVGVSKAAVSIYLKFPETSRVGAATKQKIQQAVEDLNYRPNAVARALSSAETKTIGIMIPYDGLVFRSTFVGEMLSGIQSVLYPKGYSLLFMPTEGESSRDMVANHLKMGLGYDGYILFGTRYCTLDDMKHNAQLLLETRAPFAVVNMPEIDMDINQAFDVDSPECNVTDYLVRLGHRNIVLVAGRPEAAESAEAVHEYRARLEAAEIVPSERNIIFGDYERDVARSVMIQRIEEGRDFTAVFALTDTMAAGVYEAVKQAGLTIPGDVSVVGRNDSFYAGLMDPPLTTIRRPIFDLGARAARSVLRSIKGAEDNLKVGLRTTFIQRMSTAPVFTTNPTPDGE